MPRDRAQRSYGQRVHYGGLMIWIEAWEQGYAAGRADAEALLRAILANIHYEQDEDGNWHSTYIDKPRAAVATERARAALAEQAEIDA